MIDQARLISDMARLDINVFIKDELLELMIDGEYDMAFELAYNESLRIADAMPEYRVTQPFKLINAINEEEERAKKERNRIFLTRREK